MNVIKRDGRKEVIMFDKITARIRKTYIVLSYLLSYFDFCTALCTMMYYTTVVSRQYQVKYVVEVMYV